MSLLELAKRNADRIHAEREKHEPALPGHTPRIRVPEDQTRAAERARGKQWHCPECGSRMWTIEATAQCMSRDCGARFDIVFGLDPIGRAVAAQLTRARAETMRYGIPIALASRDGHLAFRREFLGTFPPRPSPPFDASDYERPTVPPVLRDHPCPFKVDSCSGLNLPKCVDCGKVNR